jgi:hypothetical protein
MIATTTSTRVLARTFRVLIVLERWRLSALPSSILASGSRWASRSFRSRSGRTP